MCMDEHSDFNTHREAKASENEDILSPRWIHTQESLRYAHATWSPQSAIVCR